MKRDKDLLEKRIKTVAMFYEIKKLRTTAKSAVVEISQALSISVHTVNKYLAHYHREI